MDGLTINDLNQIYSMAIKSKCAQETIKHIENFIIAIPKKREIDTLTAKEIKELSVNIPIKFMIIVYFLTKNSSLEILRKRNTPYKSSTVLVKDLWNEIEPTLIKIIFFSREISTYFKDKGDTQSEEFKNWLNAAKTLIIDDIVFEEIISLNKHLIIRLYLTGVYSVEEASLANKTIKSDCNEYTVHDRRTYYLQDLYDPFQFEESQTRTAYRYFNNSPSRQTIESIFTLKFALPELTILNNDGTFLKISITEIPGFMEKHLKTKEIDKDLYNAIKIAAKSNKSLLILLSEVHGSKDSFLLHTLILRIAHSLGINHLLVETINVYHAQNGWDAQTKEIERLISFAKEGLGIQVKDLEGALHYKNTLSPYPYHGIPEQIFGVDAREASWIIDVKALKENNIMIVGSGHLNSILNSELKEMYSILPIDCTTDKEFSDMLSISQHHFIPLDWSTNHLSLDEIIVMSERCQVKS